MERVLHHINSVDLGILVYLRVRGILKSLIVNISNINFTAIVSLIKQYNDVCNLTENGLIVKKKDSSKYSSRTTSN